MRKTDEMAATLIRAVETAATPRASPRVTLSTEVDLSSESNFFSGFSTDIAEGGLFVASLTTLPIGTVLAVKFTLPDGYAITANGEVRWIRVFDERDSQRLPGMGIQFTNLHPKAKDAIALFIAMREPMFFPD